MIYLDHAATSLLKPASVAKAVYEAILSLGNSGRGANDSALDAARLIYETRELVADFFGSHNPEQVVFTLNATMALNMAIKGLLTAGDHVITTQLEHNSVLRPLYEMEERGVEVSIISSDCQGRLDYEALEAAIKQNTRLVVCTHASNLTGNLVDLERIGEMCQNHGIFFMVDASQTAGAIPIDMERAHIDVVCFTGHKGLLGPQGTGGLCVRPTCFIRTFVSGGSGIESFSKVQPSAMPVRLEAGTLNAHGIAGLRAGILYILDKGMNEIHRRQIYLMQRFLAGVKNLPTVEIYGDFSSMHRAAIVSLNIGKLDSAVVCDLLQTEYGIAVRGGGHCAPLMHKALGTITKGAVRFSFSHLNTEADIDAAIAAVAEIAKAEEV